MLSTLAPCSRADHTDWVSASQENADLDYGIDLAGDSACARGPFWLPLCTAKVGRMPSPAVLGGLSAFNIGGFDAFPREDLVHEANRHGRRRHSRSSDWTGPGGRTDAGYRGRPVCLQQTGEWVLAPRHPIRGGVAVQRTAGRLGLPNDADLDRALAFVGHVWQRFIDAIVRAQKQVFNKS